LRAARPCLDVLAGIAAVADHVQAPVPGGGQGYLEADFRLNLSGHAAEFRDASRGRMQHGGDNRKLVTG
jgi:hypothetical protein